ncbi:type VI secretion protein [Lawsonibacter asaccharolyticus]|jgi:energy-coupling factor transporter ATP-binding protein EcfA2|uniref:VirB4 family type IV secretion system protein n=1 Tax=Lawsonibacter asaccharolyticus TaxID=2108523 RepID=UPI00265B0731|nr:type VI secretion protein [Lawsonibacter asaccharolyticus]UMM45540.1 type VI secretion protein [Lawsonibacter asaccharolyticus]
MAKKVQKKTNKKVPAKAPEPRVKDFLDLIAPTAVKFNTDHYVCGGTYRCTLALRSYPASTEELALLRRLGEKSGVTVHIYNRRTSAAEEDKIIHNAENKNKLDRGSTSSMKQAVTAEANLQDVAALIASMRKNSEPLIHCAVFIELSARDPDSLRALRDEVTSELIRSKLGADRLLLRQREGFLSSNPAGRNAFGSQFERVLPAKSVANLYPFNYSGKTDPNGFYIGRDRYGSNIIVDLDRRADDKTTANVLILGNSGQGKSYLLKLLLCNILESGKSAICLDTEHELVDLCSNLGGCFIDLMSGQYRINPLEPKLWDDGSEGDDPDAPAAFRQKTRLSQHISFLKDFFRAYKDFTDQHVDTIELMLGRLYVKWGMDDNTDFQPLSPRDYPVLSDLYDVIEEAYRNYDSEEYPLYPRELLQEVLLGLHSMCRGAESKFFNGHTNITTSRFLVFGVKGLLQASRNVKNALLFNVLSYLSDKLLTKGNTAAGLDELYIWLSNLTAIEYIRNSLKRVRKKESSMILASQNLEDFDVDGVRELTRPLFAIPTHQFLFNAGSVDKKFYMDNLQLEPAEFELIRYPQRGVCLYRCGNERYLLEVHAPPYKEKLFGTAGGR